MKTKYDVIVVGAGPAGSTLARYTAAAGLDTLLVDKKGELGTPVQCSGAVSANALSECEIPFADIFINDQPNLMYWPKYRLDNCSITEVEFNPQPQLVRLNETAHLKSNVL